jgi:hypothetical protein
MMFDEHLRDAIVQEHHRQVAEGLRFSEFDLPRRGLVARWRARREAVSTPPGLAPAPARSPELTTPPFVGIRRTMPDMYR